MSIRADSSHASAESPEEFSILLRRRIKRFRADQHETAVHQHGDAARILLAGPPPLVLRIVVAVDQVAVIDPPILLGTVGLLKNVRLLRRYAPRNDKRFIFASLRAIRRIALQSQA